MVNTFKSTIGFLVLMSVSPCFAIDNPDAPDYVKDFLAEAKVYEDRIAKCDCDNTEIRNHYKEFNQFLDEKLSHAKRLVAFFVKDNEKAKKQFENSQHSWEVYAKNEKDFVNINWTKEQFGTSYLLSRFGYSATIDKQRVITLYSYAKNYPPL